MIRRLILRWLFPASGGASPSQANAAYRALMAQSVVALSEPGGIDLGPLGHADRNAILFGIQVKKER